jgi:hypothetical protein
MLEGLRLALRFAPWTPVVLGVASIILFFVIISIAARLGRISRKLDGVSARLERANTMLAQQTIYLETIADALKTAPAAAARPPLADDRASARFEPVTNEADERSASEGPIEL